MTARALSIAGSTVVGIALLTGCHASVSIGAKSVPQKTVESETARILAARVHQPTPTVSCPGDLKAKVGTTMTCQLTSQDGTEHDVLDLKVDTVNGSDAHWTISVQSPTASPTS